MVLYMSYFKRNNSKNCEVWKKVYQRILLEKFNFELLAENILFPQNRAFYSV